MLGIVDQLDQWREPFALATVVDVWKSAPRGPGAAMAVAGDGTVVGSVSVGCIEADVFARCEAVLASGLPDTVTYGISDGDSEALGMTCGGTIEVFIQRVDPATVDLPAITAAVAGGRHGALAIHLDGPEHGRIQLLDDPTVTITEADARACRGDPARSAWESARGHDRSGAVTAPDGTRIFIDLIAPQDRLLIFGAVDFAAAIADVGRLLDYHVTVCDARPTFTTPERFPSAHEVVVAWPHEYLSSLDVGPSTAICVLTHDAKFDEPLIEAACQTSAGYIGVMGSRQTHEDRLRRLRERGLGDDCLERLSSPMGLDLGGRSPHETALSILAEIVALRRGGSGLPLRDRRGSIHAGMPIGA